jgi:3-oxoadipate enol-lactonase
MNMNSATLSTGTRLAYAEAGKGQPTVLLHGYCGSQHYWDDVLPIMSAHGRIIAVDLPGHGESSAYEGVHTMDKLADDVAALLDELGIAQVNLIGHSLGGYISLAFAEKYADRLLTLTLAHSTSFPDAEAAQANRLKAAATIRSEGVAAFVDGLVPKLFAKEHLISMADQVNKAKEIGYGTSVEGAAGCALGMRERPDRGEVLESLDRPILLLAGELDEVIPPEKRFPVTRPNVTTITLSGVAHMGMMEDPQAFGEAIVSFLDRNKVSDRV